MKALLGCWVLLTTSLATACRSSNEPAPPLAGRYTLTTVNAKALPYTLLPAPNTGGCPVVLRSGSITLRADASYEARTDYGLNDGSCAASRAELGHFDLAADVLRLHGADGYERSLTVGRSTLTQHNSGDTGSATLVYAK